MRDTNSVRLLAPNSWLRGVQQTCAEWHGRPYRHVGAIISEFESQRYQPRRQLTQLLNQYDLVQIVAGTPSWALVARHLQRPTCLFVATTTAKERVTKISRSVGWRRIWLQVMTRAVSRMEQAALSNVTCVFAESEYTRQLLCSIVPAEQLLLSVPGIDTSFFCASVYCADGYILSVGRWADPRKNVRLLFKAYKRLQRLMPETPNLMLAGATTPSSDDWAYAVSLGIGDRIHVRQNVTKEELRCLYQNAALFVLPSDEEGLGVVILEAMACGLPVISTRCGGPATAVADGVTGYLTPVGDAEALALRMAELIRDPMLRSRMGQEGRRVAEQRFSLAAAGKVYLDKYDELLGIGR
jgi:D-inositol-3-phosphate glycosyltransferase